MTSIDDHSNATEAPERADHSRPAGDLTQAGERRLRVVLRLNAGSSAICGVVLAAAPDAVDDLLETGHPGWVRIVGLALLPFAAVVAWLSTSSVDRLRAVTPAIVAADVGWVAASVVTVIAGWYSASGIVAVLAMAAVVDLWAVLQWRAWRRLSGTSTTSTISDRRS